MHDSMNKALLFIKRLQSNDTGGPLFGLIGLCIIFSLASPYFMTSRNLFNVLDQITVLGIISLGMTFVIITGGIDLSVGSTLAFSMMMMGWLSRNIGIPFGLALFCGLVTGALCGLISGWLIAFAKVPPFIATLALMSSARGLANILTDGQQIVGYSDQFTNITTIRHAGFFSITMSIFIVLCLAAWFFLKYRQEGHYLYAIGGNSEVARLAGINVRYTLLLVYIFSGLMAGVAAIVLAARLDSSQPSAGLGYELDAIAAVVIGGTSLSGGRGNIAGTVIGVLIIGVLRNALNLLAVSPFFQQIIIGIVIAVAVLIDISRRNPSR